MGAIIKPFELDEVKEALSAAGIEGMTAAEVKGPGRQKGHPEVDRRSEYTVGFVPKAKFKIAVANDAAAKVAEVILKAAGTDKIGNGRIFVMPLDEVIRVRTGETGEKAA